jgi:hypothetical protein
MPIEISEVAVVAADNKIYVIGGSTRDRVDQQVVLQYDTASDGWRERAPLSRGLTHAGATTLKGGFM